MNGRIHGVLRRWHKNGVLALEQPHEQGATNGICRQWGEDGKLLGSFEIQRGTGIHRHWHDNGQLQSEVSCVDGALSGRHRSWLRDGTLLFEQYYLKNLAVDRHTYEAACSKDPRLPKYKDKKKEIVASPGVALELRTHRLFIESMLQKPNQAEARTWLAKGKPKKGRVRLGDFKSERTALKFVERLYSAGVVSVTAVDIYWNPKGDAFCDRLIIQLPKQATRRSAIREICQILRAKDRAALSPESDLGETHLSLLLG